MPEHSLDTNGMMQIVSLSDSHYVTDIKIIHVTEKLYKIVEILILNFKASFVELIYTHLTR